MFNEANASLIMNKLEQSSSLCITLSQAELDLCYQAPSALGLDNFRFQRLQK